MEKLGQLSPICRSPQSKGQNVRRIINKDGGITERAVECLGSIKRLISPPQESLNAKRSRTANPMAQTDCNLKVMRPVKTPNFSRDQSEGPSRGTEVVINDNRNKMTSSESVWKSKMEVKSKNEIHSGFTLITEQKATEAEASENPNTHLDIDTHTLTVHKHIPSTKTIAYAMQRSAKDAEIDINKKGATSTAITSSRGDQDNGKSSDEERAGGMLIHFGCHQVHVFFFLLLLT